MIGDNSDSLFVLDMDGKNISEYYCSAGEQIGKPMNTEDGELIFHVIIKMIKQQACCG